MLVIEQLQKIEYICAACLVLGIIHRRILGPELMEKYTESKGEKSTAGQR